MTLLLILLVAFTVAMLAAGCVGHYLGWHRRGVRFKLVEEQLRNERTAAQREARKAEARAVLAQGQLEWEHTNALLSGPRAFFAERN
jgi:hypothetical protein